MADRNWLDFGVGDRTAWLDFSEGINWFGCGVVCLNWVEFSVEIGIDFVFAWGVKIDLTWMWASKLTCFCAGVNIDLIFVRGPKITCCWRGYRLTYWFLCGCRNWLGFLRGLKSLDLSLSIEIGLIFFWAVEIKLISMWGMEHDLISVGMKLIWLLCRWSKLTWFQYRDRNWLGFCVAVENGFFFRVWIEINSNVVSGHRNQLYITMGIEIDLISVMESKLTPFLCGESKFAWF